MPESNLIQFKRGAMSALETLITNKQGIDGTFYLTIDDDATGSNNPSKSSRLFVGRADGSIVPVNQGIITVATTSALTNNIQGKWHAGDYAYVTEGNILAIYDGQTWKQINSVGTDTYVTSFAQTVAADGTTANKVNINSQATLNAVPASGESIYKSDSFSITGADGITVSASGKNVTVAGDPYTLSSAAVTEGTNTATINLKHGSDGTTSAGTVTVSSANNNRVRISGSANNIVIDSPIIASTTLAAQAQGFAVQSTDSWSNSTAASSIDPTIVYGGSGNQTAHFANGAATLDVYTKDEIDKLKSDFNAVTYMGTLGTGGTYASVASAPALHNGDMYMVVGSDGVDVGNQHANAGDLVIIRGTEITAEDNPADPSTIGTIPKNSATLTYDIVPSGNDIDTYYTGTAITHGWQITKARGDGDNLGSLSLATPNNSIITLTDSGTSPNRVVTIDHGNVNQSNINVTGADVSKTQGQATTFTTISGITVNQQGHVTGVTTNTLSLPAENGADISSVVDTVSGSVTHSGVGTNSATVQTAVQLTKNDGSSGTAKSSAFTLSSDNLAVTADATNKDVKMNFVWGTF